MLTKRPILDIYCGKFGSMEQIKVDTKKWNECVALLESADKEFRALLAKDENLLALYKKVTDALEGTFSEEMDACYRSAFRWGVLLGMDIVGFFDET